MKRLIYHKLYWSFLLALLCALSLSHNITLAYTSPGTAIGYVSDFANIISDDVQQDLERKLSAEYASSSNQIAIVTVKSLGGDYIENYAEKLFAEWGVGSKVKDNGILFLIASEDKKVRIEVGYGLEPVITDALSSQILRRDVLPVFKDSKYEAGIVAGTDSILKALQSDAGRVVDTEYNEDSGDIVGLLLFFGIQGILFLSSILARSKSWWLGGIIGAGIGSAITIFGLFGITLVTGVVLTVLVTLFGLFFDYIVSSTYKKAKANGEVIPWWTGGSYGGSSSGGFGGFGGGSSGGGGASGSW
jgi:uncharacterized protein